MLSRTTMTGQNHRPAECAYLWAGRGQEADARAALPARIFGVVPASAAAEVAAAE